MKLIIEVTEKYYEACKDTIREGYPSQLEETIGKGIPVDASGDLISAPTVEPEITEKQAITKIINSGWLVNHDKELREKWERPKCDCEKCDYRKFTEKFVDGFVDVLNKYGITII